MGQTRVGPVRSPGGTAGRLRRVRGGGHQRGGVPEFRGRVPGARRDPRTPEPAGRHGRLVGADLMSREGADARLGRLLAIVPWIAAQDGPSLDEVSRRFGVAEKDLIADLNLLFLCGVHPFTPDVLIDVNIA